MTEIRTLPLGQVHRNVDQPRTDFPKDHIEALAASIRERGLLQPITVRRLADDRFEIVAGECRWRAHQLLGAATIDARIVDMDESERDLNAIVENLQRRDVHPLEEARAYQRMLDKGWAVDALAKSVGTTENRVLERIGLLKMRPEYQSLFQTGQIDRNMARELASLPPHAQDALFQLIRKGEFANSNGRQCDGSTRLREVANQMRHDLAQGSMFDLPPEPTEEEKSKAAAIQRKIDQLCGMLNQGFDDGDIAITRKVDPNLAATYADKLALIGRHVAMLERALRTSATVAQAQLALVSATEKADV
jgi:ParB family chromosome partitioning protein